MRISGDPCERARRAAGQPRPARRRVKRAFFLQCHADALKLDARSSKAERWILPPRSPDLSKPREGNPSGGIELPTNMRRDLRDG